MPHPLIPSPKEKGLNGKNNETTNCSHTKFKASISAKTDVDGFELEYIER